MKEKWLFSFNFLELEMNLLFLIDFTTEATDIRENREHTR